MGSRFTYTFRVEGGRPVAVSRDELTIFGLAAHPGSAGAYFMNADISLCRRCIVEQRWPTDADVDHELDDEALVVFSPSMRCDECGRDGAAV